MRSLLHLMYTDSSCHTRNPIPRIESGHIARTPDIGPHSGASLPRGSLQLSHEAAQGKGTVAWSA